MAAVVWAHESSVPPGNTGAPGDAPVPCLGCHAGRLNPPGGKVEIGFPGGLSYTPGVKQRWALRISDPDPLRHYGFQATARSAHEGREAQAGTFTPVDGSTATVADGSWQYIHQTQNRIGSFTFEWTPPASGAGDIRVYVAAAAARVKNDTHVYTASSTLKPAAGRPSIAANGVVNGASFEAGLSAGAWMTVTGSNLAAAARAWRESDFQGDKLPTQLDGVGANVNGKPGFVYYVSPGQINFQAPSDDAEGPVQVEVVTPQGRSEPVTALKQKFAPALFRFDAEGRRYVAAVHPDGALVGKPGLVPGAPTRPAKPGDIILLFGTGFGPTEPATAAGEILRQPARLADPVAIRIGNLSAGVAFAGLTAAGLCQFNVTVPNLADGDAAVEAEIAGVRTPGRAFLTIQR